MKNIEFMCIQDFVLIILFYFLLLMRTTKKNYRNKLISLQVRLFNKAVSFINFILFERKYEWTAMKNSKEIRLDNARKLGNIH